MEERGYIAEALFSRLRESGWAFRIMGDASQYPESAPPEIEVAVPRETLWQTPAMLARFAQDFDLRLVQLERAQRRAWRAALAWTDELGRPRFLALRLFAGASDDVFACALLDAVERGVLSEERAAWLTSLWADAVPREWRSDAHRRLIAQAARTGNWQALRARLPELRRALGLRLPWLAPRRPRVLFIGRESPQRSHLMTHVQAQLAPLGLRMLEQQPGTHARGDFRVVFEAPPGLGALDDAVLLRREQPLSAMIGETVSAVLRWLEVGIERRYADAVIGPNPWSARLLQAFPWTGFFLGSRIACRLHSPVLMPHPHGIVIEAGVQIGSRVTVMHQVTIGRKNPLPLQEEGGPMPVIGDNVFIGPGAKVLGPVRVGRGATVGANAVVTRDVPSHCTVVGANRILGVEAPSVAARRREEEETVVNT